MKPIIIIKETNKDGKFEFTEKELKDLIEQAYKQGFEDAKAQYQPKLNQPWIVKGTIPGDDFYNHITPCGTTTGQPNPAVTLNGSSVSTGV